MSTLHDRIAQFRKMATEDPDNELGHYRLGQLLAEDGQFDDAVKSFERTLEITPTFSKVYQLLGETHIKAGNKETAAAALTKGYTVADEQGDRMPRDAMARLLTDLGAPIPAAAKPIEDDGPETGFKCHRPGCPSGKRAKPLTSPPPVGPIGERIVRDVCVDCWKLWLSNQYSYKVINELRLDLSTEFGQKEYDKYMREFLGFEPEADESPVK